LDEDAIIEDSVDEDVFLASGLNLVFVSIKVLLSDFVGKLFVMLRVFALVDVDRLLFLFGALGWGLLGLRVNH